jgi:transcription factor IIIB subunit 2
MHSFRRTQQQIIRVVHICDSTLKNRLDEFGKTPASALTKADFDSGALDDLDAQDPPAFRRAQASHLVEDKVLQQIENGTGKSVDVNAAKLKQGAEDAAKAITTISTELANLSEPGKQGMAVGRRKKAQDSPEQKAPERRIENFLFRIDELTGRIEKLDDEKLVKLCRQLQVATGGKTKTKLKRVMAVAQTCPNAVRWSYARMEADNKPPRPALLTKRTMNVDGEAEEPTVRPDLSEDGTATDGDSFDHSQAVAEGQSADSIMVRLPSPSLDDGSEDENLSDCDDDIESYLVKDKAEIDAKTKIWMSMNGEFLEAQAEKRKRLEEDIAAGRVTEPRKRKKRKGDSEVLAGTAAEAAMQALQEKKVSSKVNYSVLQGLFSQPNAADVTVAASGDEDGAAAEAPTEPSQHVDTAPPAAKTAADVAPAMQVAAPPPELSDDEDGEEEKEAGDGDDDEDAGIYGEDWGAEAESDDN